MRIAALYDIHGNLPALDAVLRDVEDAAVDAIVIGGDVVPGPLLRETIARLRALDVPAHGIRGNGESAVLGEAAGRSFDGPADVQAVIRWSAAQLDDRDREWLGNWPLTLRLTLDDVGDVLFCHATPRDDNEIFTRVTPDDRVAPAFAGIDTAVVVCGHTHMPFDRRLGAVRIVNAGSVGMPFGRPGADWLLLGPGVEARHTDYDIASAAERMQRTTYPNATDFVARYIVSPPSAERMLQAFESVAMV